MTSDVFFFSLPFKAFCPSIIEIYSFLRAAYSLKNVITSLDFCWIMSRKLLILCSAIDFSLELSFKASISLTMAFSSVSIDWRGNLIYSNQLLYISYNLYIWDSSNIHLEDMWMEGSKLMGSSGQFSIGKYFTLPHLSNSKIFTIIGQYIFLIFDALRR